MKCCYCNKEIKDINTMIKTMHSYCAKEVVDAYCFVNDSKLIKTPPPKTRLK